MPRARKRDLLLGIFQPKHPYLPGTEILRQVDVERIAGKLAVDEQARQDGVDGVPPADGVTLSVKEREIVGEIRRIWDESVEGARRSYAGYQGRHASHASNLGIDAHLTQPAAVAVELKEAAREDRARLRDDYREVKLALGDLARFREAEGITHAPRIGPGLAWKILFLSAAALLEIVVNAAIFGVNDPQGVLGSVLKVMVIPVANIAGGWLWTHWIVRQVLRKDWIPRIIGVVGCLWTAFWLFGINLIVAHWRESAEAALTLQAVTDSIGDAFAHPFGLHSYNSWGLFIIGCFAGAVAIYEGWSWNDPHPGYSRRSRQAQVKADEWWGYRQDALDRLKEIHGEFAERLSAAQRDLKLAATEMPELADKSKALGEDMRLFSAHLLWACEELGARYREANLRARTGETPAQFKKPLTLSLDVPVFDVLSARGPAAPPAERLGEAIREIAQAYAEACAAIPSPADLDGAPAPP